MIKLGLLGRMASGKTTLSEYFINKYKGERVAFADALKNDIIQYGLTSDGFIEKSRDRSLLQDYGQLRRNELWTLNMLPHRILYNDNGTCKLEEIELNTTFELGKSYPEYWIDQAIKKALELTKTSNVVIDDIRRKNEGNALRNNGFNIIKIIASDAVRKARLIQRDGAYDENSLNDISETEIDDIPFDFSIDNNTDTEASQSALSSIVTMLTE